MTPALQVRPARADDTLGLDVLVTQVFLDTCATTGIRDAMARQVQAAFCPPAQRTPLADHGATVCTVEGESHPNRRLATTRAAKEPPCPS